MAYTYLDLTNEVLARMNEVTLTASNFRTARGFQIQCKNAVNDSINFINQREFNWPFNHSSETELLVPGKTRYTIPPTAKTVDYDTFRLVKDSSLGATGGGLPRLDYKEYIEKYVDQEDDTVLQGGQPRCVVRTPDNNYLLYPYPDKTYSLKYEYYSQPTALSEHSDVPGIPEAYRQTVVDGATAYAYQYRGELDQYNSNWSRFQQGISDIRSIMTNRYPYVRSTVTGRSGSTSVFPSIL